MTLLSSEEKVVEEVEDVVEDSSDSLLDPFLSVVPVVVSVSERGSVCAAGMAWLCIRSAMW